jgi:two-component system NarL family sensor kinase
MIEAYLGAWKELTQEALNSLRSALAGLRIHPHAQLGLPSALHRYLAPQVRGSGVRMAIECHQWPTMLPLDWTSALYLTVREALTNVEKHAHASEVTVLLRASNDHLQIVIADNGVGISLDDLDLDYAAKSGTGFGLRGMRERVVALGGRLSLISAPGGGVRLEIRLPHPPGQPTDAPEVAPRAAAVQRH